MSGSRLALAPWLRTSETRALSKDRLDLTKAMKSLWAFIAGAACGEN